MLGPAPTFHMHLWTSRTLAITCFQDLPVLLCPSCFHLFLHSWSLLLAPEALSSGLLALTVPPEGSHSTVIQHILFGSGTWARGQRLLPEVLGCRGSLVTIWRRAGTGGQAVGNSEISHPASLSCPAVTARAPCQDSMDVLIWTWQLAPGRLENPTPQNIRT